jgi:eukaryotic-like serine/threonine-protein kinase
LGPYEILALIGAGGMGEVYRARDSRLHREVAIKVLPEGFANDSERLHRFEQEAWAAGMLNHANLLTVHDFGSHEGSPYVVTELLEGQTLRARLDAGLVPVRKAREWALQMARGLAAVHQKGIVHRDLKPENVFLTHDGSLKILDFGLAKLSERSLEAVSGVQETVAFRTEPGFILGTFGYMAPEQVRGRAPDPRADIFSLGLILYEMLTGTRAFGGESSIEMMNAILKDDPPELIASGRAVPPALERVVRHCLEKAAEDRFQSARDLAFALGALSGIEEAAPAGFEGSRALSKRIQVAAGVIAALLVGMALSSWILHPRPSEPPTFRYLTYSGRDYSPAASPSGRFVAFTSERDGTARIWIKELSGGDERPLTVGPDDLARFSPLGSTLLFSRRENGRTSLYRVGVLGGEPRKIIDDAVEGDWSPDGKQIAFLRWKNVNGRLISAIGSVSPNGSDTREIAAHDQKLAHLRWSPEGTAIVALELAQSGAQRPLFWMSADGREKRAIPLPKPGYAVSSPAWLSEEELVYFQSESALQSGLGVNAGTANIVRQNVRTGDSERISWSPESSTLVDVLGPGRVVYDTCSPRASLREFRLQGQSSAGPTHWLTRGNSNDRQPAYSPDGDWLVFSSNRSGNLDLWEMSLKTEIVRRVTEDEAEDWDPVFSADGKAVIWSSNRAGHFEIWTAAADGSGPRQVSHDGVDAENPSVTPDGKWVVYGSGNPDKEGLWKVRPDGSNAARILPGSFAFPEVSPDGRYVLYSSDYMTERLALHVAEVDTGTVLPFEIRVGTQATKPASALGRARWMPGGKAIAYIGQNEKGTNGIFVQDFAPDRDTTASRRPLAGFDDERTTESFGMSSDGTRLAIAGWEQMFSLMLAERIPSIAPRRGSR